MKLNPTNCFWGGYSKSEENIRKNTDYSSCWFDQWSIMHAVNPMIIFTGLLMLITFFGKLSTKSTIWIFVLVDLIHGIDEILNIYTPYSLESIKDGRVIIDGDTVQNCLGDIISSFLGTGIILVVALVSKDIYLTLGYHLLITHV